MYLALMLLLTGLSRCSLFVEQSQVGKRHKDFGVTPSYFPYMGEALRFALKEKMQGAFTNDHNESWEEVYEELSSEIIKAMLA